MRLELGYVEPAAKAAARLQRSLAWEAPLLPSIPEGSVPRWSTIPTWTPPGTHLLVRHRSREDGRCLVTNDRVSPDGFEIEFDLGLVHQFAQPGTQRLIATPDGFVRTRIEGELDEELTGLGYVEEAPLPLLDALEIRRDPLSGRPTLVAGPEDPLFARAEPLGVVGFIESYPINPRRPLDRRVDWWTVPLRRRSDESAWRHRYAASRDPADGLSLGGLWPVPAPGFVALEQLPDGRLSTSLLPAGQVARTPVAAARWVGAPLKWGGRRPQAWAMRAAAARAQRLAGERGQAPPAGRPVTLGYVRQEPAPGWSLLVSATHPALPDQFITRSELEATDLGYEVDGVLGRVADGGADRSRDAQPAEIKWGSRFGQERRYYEGLHDG